MFYQWGRKHLAESVEFPRVPFEMTTAVFYICLHSSNESLKRKATKYNEHVRAQNQQR